MSISAASLIAIVTADTMQAEAALERTAAKFDGVGEAASGSAVAGVAKFGGAVLLAGGILAAFSASKAIAFQAAMVKVGALTDAGAGAIKGMSQQILELAPKVAQTPVALAKAMYFIASAGETGKTAMTTLTLAAEAATSGLGQTQDVAQVLISTLNAYHQNVSQIKTDTNQMVAAVTEGHMPADELANALGRVIGVSASLHVSFPELLANIATLTKEGMSASQAATSVQSVETALVKLLDPSKSAAQAMDTLGLSGEKINDALRQNGLHGALELIQQSMDKVTKAGGNADLQFVKLFPNVRALRDVLGTVTSQGKNYQEVLDKITGSSAGAGRAAQAFALTQTTAKYQIHSLEAEIDVLAIKLGDQLLVIFGKVAHETMIVVGWFEKHKQISKELAETIGVMLAGAVAVFLAGVIAAAAPIIAWTALIGGAIFAIIRLYDHSKAFRDAVKTVFADVAQAWTGLVDGITGKTAQLSGIARTAEEIGSGFRTAGIDIAKFGEGFAGVGRDLGNFGTAGRIVREIFVDIGKAVDGLVRGMFDLGGHVTGISRGFQIFGEMIRMTITNMIDVIRWGVELSDMFLHVYEAIYKAGAALVGWFRDHWAEIKSAVMIALAPIEAGIWLLVKLWQDVLGPALKVVGDLFAAVWSGITTVLKAAWDLIYGIVKTGTEMIFDTIGIVLDLITGHWGKAWDDLKRLVGDAFKGILNTVISVFGDVLHFLAGIPGRILSVLGDLGKLLLKAGGSLIAGLLSGAVHGFVSVGKWFLELAPKILKYVALFPLILVDVGVRLIFGLVKGIVSVAPSVWRWFQALPATIIGLVKTAGIWLWQTGLNLLQGMWNGIVAGAKAVWGWFRALPGYIWGLVAAAGDWLLATGGRLIGGLVHGITSGAAGVWSWFRALPGVIGGMLAGAGSWLVQTGEHIIQGLINGIGNMAGSLMSTISHIAGSIISGIGKFLGIHSPSTVMHEVGVNVGQGLVNGIASTVPKVTAAMATISAAVTKDLALMGFTSVTQARAAMGDVTATSAKFLSDLKKLVAAQAKSPTTIPVNLLPIWEKAGALTPAEQKKIANQNALAALAKTITADEKQLGYAGNADARAGLGDTKASSAKFLRDLQAATIANNKMVAAAMREIATSVATDLKLTGFKSQAAARAALGDTNASDAKFLTDLKNEVSQRTNSAAFGGVTHNTTVINVNGSIVTAREIAQQALTHVHLQQRLSGPLLQAVRR